MNMNEVLLHHWFLDMNADGIVWARLNYADGSANTLGCAVLAEFSLILDQLEWQPPKGLIVCSGKESGFIAGANLEEYTRLENVDAAKALVQRNWDLFNRLAAVPYPTLALIRGYCLGGGLELSLACHYRIAVDQPDTRLALPEVMLGIVPGWGGMLRLPQLIGPTAALDMMLTGKQINAQRAKKMGLVDECVPARVMDNAARSLLLSGRPAHRPPWSSLLLNGPFKALVASSARKQVVKRARPEHYPAPYAIIDIWQHYHGNALSVPANQHSSLDYLLTQGTARNLIRVFFLQQRLKALGKPNSSEDTFKAHHVHVIGAGTMGGDIAAWCVQHGLTVTLQDRSVEFIAPAIQRASEGFAKKYRTDKKQMRFALDRLIADPNGMGVEHADVIVEAVFEDLEVKRALFRQLEKRARPEAILATNTSSLCIEDIASVLKQPSRMVGIHFFNPVVKMPLVEVVYQAHLAAPLDDLQVKNTMAFVHQIDKLPLPVASAPGFLVNAVLGPYLLEAMHCVDEGISPSEIDAAMLAFGMPMGPIELVDTVGLDIVLAAGKSIAIGEVVIPKILYDLVQARRLGRKTGRGFYEWYEGSARRNVVNHPRAGLAERLLKPLLEACQRCVANKVVGDEDLADAGVIFGAGFAPYTGGPFHYMKTSNHD